ncbi:uncharacterized protein [Palaemon carinicauda]|uniref:uncharacterized protein n=1 Tax=Palaemon carinicauda TaxID=392227 RepID=UPI0035B6853D
MNLECNIHFCLSPSILQIHFHLSKLLRNLGDQVGEDLSLPLVFGPGRLRHPRPSLRDLSDLQEEREQNQGIGHLPLSPRPTFDAPEFNGPIQEEELERGFVPIVPGEKSDEENEGNQSFDIPPPPSEERSSPEPTVHSTFAPQRHSGESHQENFNLSPEVVPPHSREEPSFPREPLFADPGRPNFNQGLEEQQTQEIEFLSAPPPTSNIRKRNTAKPRRPAHPNQIPVYHEIYNQNGELVQGGQEGEEEEEEEPDRLAILLLDSKFSCQGKNNGYYADEDVSCEVFHYCQDTVKHSWLCPEGASFHQVHLICMPRSEDNICERSSTFHFVNDFLYKELEGPNKTYADRYYPEGFADRGSTINLQAAVAPNEGEYQAVQQVARFPVTQPSRRPVIVQDQGPPVYQPAVQEQHIGQSFQPSQGIHDRVQHGVPDFQSTDHFSGFVGQHTSSSFEPTPDFGGDGQRPFSAFHSPEEVRVQRPHARPHFRPGRRPGNRP